MNVNNAFLNDDFIEKVYMQPPPSYEHPPNKAFHLHWVLYGLKQAHKTWFDKFQSVVSQQGCLSSSYDFSFFLRTTCATIILLLLYVDDIIITSDNIACIWDIQNFDTLTTFLALKLFWVQTIIISLKPNML